MSQEHPRLPRPEDEFGLSEKERLFDRINYQRLLEFLESDTTVVHRMEESYNDYGEFLFVTVSRPGQQQRVWMTFYGAGYHEYRERWVTDEWFWYRSSPFPSDQQEPIAREEAIERVRERLESIRPENSQRGQTRRGQLFEMLADLTDEDGAYTEMQDLDDWLDLE